MLWQPATRDDPYSTLHCVIIYLLSRYLFAHTMVLCLTALLSCFSLDDVHLVSHSCMWALRPEPYNPAVQRRVGLHGRKANDFSNLSLLRAHQFDVSKTKP